MTATVRAPLPSPRLLLGATSLAPVAWVVHIALLPALVPLACERGATWPLHLATAALLVPAVAGIVAAHRARRDVRVARTDEPNAADTADTADTAAERARTFAAVGLLVSWGFTALIVAEHVPVFVLEACPP